MGGEKYSVIIKIGVKMDISATNGLASYQQTVNQTPGLSSSVYPEGTSIQLPIVVQIIPSNYINNRGKDLLEEKTA
jgi:hypothetical protein